MNKLRTRSFRLEILDRHVSRFLTRGVRASMRDVRGGGGSVSWCLSVASGVAGNVPQGALGRRESLRGRCSCALLPALGAGWWVAGRVMAGVMLHGALRRRLVPSFV